MFEKKRGKRFLASVMALVMLLSLAPVGALAAGGGGYGISVNLNETSRGECNVYYAETKTAYLDTSTDQNLTELNQGGSVTHNRSENLTSYGVIFFVAPHDGYALEGLGATASAGIYQSIVNNENLRQTDFWTKNSQIENLTRAGFTEEQIETLAQNAKDRGCVAAFIFTRSASDRKDINSNLNFTTHQLATFEKSITAVKSGDTTYTEESLNNVKVRVGDVITYSFKVTFYPDGNNITYSDIVVTDERLGGEDSRITFTDSSSAGTQTETKNYTVTSEDIRTGKLENTATLTYKYKAPYNVGAVNSTATATAKIATVSAVSYQYDNGPRPSDATDVTTGVYAPTEHSEGESVTVAANPTGTGYTFSGWTAENASVNNERNFTMPNAPVIFTGSWTAKKDVSYTVRYLEQGTDKEIANPVTREEQTFDSTVTEQAIEVTGYTAVGSTSQEVKLDAYNKEITFYYEPNAVTYTVIFNANGGAWSGTTVGEYTVSEGKASRSGVPGTEKITSTSITAPTNQGKVLDGWGYYDNGKLIKIDNLDLPIDYAPTVKQLCDAFGSTNTVTLYAIWKDDTTSADSLTYTINQHYIRSETDTDNIQIDGLLSERGTEISKLIEGEAKNQDWRGNHYFYDSEKTTVNGTTLANNATLESKGTVIDLYYYLDEVGETSKENPNGGPDNIPDAWQYKVTFKVANGKWNNETKADIVKYVTKKDDTDKASATGTATLKKEDIPAVGDKPDSGYTASGSWKPTPSTGLEITKDTVFTYTYDQKSGGSGGSGGSSRPSTPPTVDIPDDVPTGLNGKDHYAYIIGYGNNDVRPQNNITRAEVATIFFRLLTDETREANMTKSNGYNDVKDGDWFCCAVSTLSKMGIIKGYEDGSFKPNAPISRAEFAAIAARFDPDGDKTPATFADVTSHWAKDEISIAANHGWIKGYEDGSFKPDQKITRAETMTLVNRVLNRLPEAKDDLHKDMKTWVDNMDETAWYYLAVQEATNSHYFKNKTGTKFEQWTDLRDTRDWSELEK